MTRHGIALAILLAVGLVAWAGVNLVVGPRLLASAGRDRLGAAREAGGAAVASGVGEPGAGAALSAAESAREPRILPVPSGGAPVTEATAIRSAEAAASAGSAVGSTTGGAAAPEPVARLLFSARSPNFEPGTRTEIFDLVRRLKGEPERRARLVGRGDPESDGDAAPTLARRRVEGVREFMVTLGIPVERLVVEVAPVAAAPSSGAAGDGRAVDVFLE